jgi:hypothetical protein
MPALYLLTRTVSESIPLTENGEAFEENRAGCTYVALRIQDVDLRVPDLALRVHDEAERTT